MPGTAPALEGPPCAPPHVHFNTFGGVRQHRPVPKLPALTNFHLPPSCRPKVPSWPHRLSQTTSGARSHCLHDPNAAWGPTMGHVS